MLHWIRTSDKETEPKKMLYIFWTTRMPCHRCQINGIIHSQFQVVSYVSMSGCIYISSTKNTSFPPNNHLFFSSWQQLHTCIWEVQSLFKITLVKGIKVNAEETAKVSLTTLHVKEVAIYCILSHIHESCSGLSPPLRYKFVQASSMAQSSCVSQLLVMRAVVALSTFGTKLLSLIFPFVIFHAWLASVLPSMLSWTK